MDESDSIIEKYNYVNQESPQMIIQLSQERFKNQEYNQAYELLYLLTKREISFPNLHYNLAICCKKLQDYDKTIYHLNEELKHYDNLAALELLQKFKLKETTPILTITLTLLIVGINFLFFSNLSIIELYTFGLHKDNISLFSLITSFFLHSSLFHLLSNCVVLLLLGSLVEKFMKNWEFLSIFFITGMLSNILQVSTSPEFSIIVGISGSLFGLFAIILLKAPLLSIKLFDIKISVLVILGIVYIISLFTLTYFNQVAHMSHLFGFLIGMGIGVLINSYLRTKFYPMLVYTFGILLFTSVITQSNPVLFMPIIDFIFGIVCVYYAYSVLSLRQHYVEALEE